MQIGYSPNGIDHTSQAEKYKRAMNDSVTYLKLLAVK